MPPEDAYKSVGNVHCVADGITRDPIIPTDAICKTKGERLQYYPNPSGARSAADACCDVFCEVLSETDSSVGEPEVKQALVEANKAIKVLNDKNIPEVDYLQNDYWGCVACGGVIVNNVLHWVGIGDCGLIVFTADGSVRFHTPDWLTNYTEYASAHLLTESFNSNHPECRVKIRSEYRNNPEQIVNGERVSYGALTGEEAASEFMYTGTVELSPGDLVVFYSDGFTETVVEPDFFTTLYQPTESLMDQKFIPYTLQLAHQDESAHGRERTMIAFVV